MSLELDQLPSTAMWNWTYLLKNINVLERIKTKSARLAKNMKLDKTFIVWFPELLDKAQIIK